MSALRPLVLAILFLFLTVPAWAQQWNPDQGLVLRGKVITQDTNRRVITTGFVAIKGNIIQAVCDRVDDLPAEFQNAPQVETGGIILPGLIDTHNHVQFNFQNIWEAPKLYENRGQWLRDHDYKNRSNDSKAALANPAPRGAGLRSELIKYGEIKSLVGGTTSIQGSDGRTFFLRGIDYGLELTGDEKDTVMQRMPNVNHARFIRDNKTLYVLVAKGSGPLRGARMGVDGVYYETLQKAEAALAERADRNDLEVRVRPPRSVIDKMDDGRCTCWLAHVAEGSDGRSLREWEILEELGLIRDETVVIHGVPLRREHFRTMAKVDCDLVWSPLSNRLLYGITTDIPTALAEGVNISLAPDWTPSGSKNLLGELKIADEIDNAEWGDVLSYRKLVDMVTVNPAKALQWDDRVGRIKPGFAADILVIDDRGDPYGSVVHAVDRNVKLVIVDGEPLYGDDEHMEFLKGDDCEVLYDEGGRVKLIDVTHDSDEDPRPEQSMEEIEKAIDEALQAFNAELDPRFDPVTRQTIYTEGDHAIFDAIAGSTNANLAGFEQYWANPEGNVGEAEEPPAPQGVVPTGTVGGSLSGTRRASLYDVARGRRMARLTQGTPVQELERRSLTSRSHWVKVRVLVDDEIVEGWMSQRYYDETTAEASGLINALDD